MNEARKSNCLKLITKKFDKIYQNKINPKNILYFSQFLEIATTHAADDGGGRQIQYICKIYLYEICTTRMPDVTMVPLVDNLMRIVPDRQI